MLEKLSMKRMRLERLTPDFPQLTSITLHSFALEAAKEFEILGTHFWDGFEKICLSWNGFGSKMGNMTVTSKEV